MDISCRLSKAVPKLLLVLATLFLVINMVNPLAKADRGDFSPSRVQVAEAEQKAIIAWNGTYEALILSTDVTSMNESEVVEIMPPAIKSNDRQRGNKLV